MAHFALINDKNIVEQVIVVSNDDCGGGEFPQSEPVGQVFIASLPLPGIWKQTSYHANFRGKYAQINDVFENDEFVTVAQVPFRD